MERARERAHVAAGRVHAGAPRRRPLGRIRVPCERVVNENYMSGFVRAFDQPTLRCAGTLDGAAWPHTFAVDLAAPDAAAQLAQLHLDHEQPVHLMCAAWAKALPAEPRAWSVVRGLGREGLGGAR